MLFLPTFWISKSSQLISLPSFFSSLSVFSLIAYTVILQTLYHNTEIQRVKQNVIYFQGNMPFSNMIQMPTPKVGLFGTFSKMGSKIRKISKFQNDVEIALINEIHWNLRQMEALGLNFRNFLKFWIFVNFWRFCTHLNIPHMDFIFEKSRKIRKSEIWIYVFSRNFWTIECSQN